MPTHRQLTTDVAAGQVRGPGRSDTATMQAMFATSPVFNDYTPDAVRATGQELLVDAIVNDGGHTFGEFDRDYTGTLGTIGEPVPDMSTVEAGPGGLPGSPYTPNPGSPGEGNGVDPAALPAPPENWPPPAGSEWGAPLGTIAAQSTDPEASPHLASQKIARQRIGDYIFGRSTSPDVG